MIPSSFAQDLTDFVSDEDQSGSEDFVLDADGTAGAGDTLTIQFGSIINETLGWDVDNDYFILSDALVVDGNLNIQGTVFRLDSDEVGNPDQDLDIVAEQGSEADGVIRYDDGNNRWEISNNGGPFAAISTGGGSSDFEGVYTTDVDKVLTTSNGSFTINAGTGAIGVNASTGGVSINNSVNGAVNIATGTSTGAVSIGGNANTISINSSSWDISAAGIATGLTGMTSTGSIDFSAASNITIPHTNSTAFTLDNDNAGAGVNVSIVANQGSNPDGTIRYNTTTNQWEMSNDGGGYVPLAGWHGSPTRIKIMPTDFESDDGDDNFIIVSDGTQSSASSGTTDALAMIPLPTGYRATAVQIYGSDTNNPVTVYANEIDDGTTSTNLGSGTVIGEINITDTDSTTTNYLSIYVDLGGGDDIYGGYITIVPIP
ncbi:MAG: hypothetical protein AB7J46_03540 [Candidatus Altimarinota bacterium]